jgi:phosphoglycerate dehydrogenase-like enzyme
MRNPSVFLYSHLDDEGHALIRATVPADRLIVADKHRDAAAHEGYLKQFRECDVCFGNVPAEWLPQAKKLRWMQLESIGFEYYQHVRGLPAGLEITNLKGLFDQPAAETALAGLLAIYRGLDQLLPAQAERRWVSLEVRPRMQLLRGKRVVILGYGSIGKKLRQLLEAFGCEVRNYARTTAGAELRTPTELDAALPSSDIVACCLPKTPDTLNFIDRRRLGLMSPNCVFVNIGRGRVVDEPALVDVLQRRQLGGAVLDVTWDEPIPSDHALWSCPNTLLMQHTGGGYSGELMAKVHAFLGNYARFQAEQPLHNVVDLARGY